MPALFFGSIGTLSDTSELQREAFNAAFARHGLDWSWDRDTYREKLRDSGGRARIAAEAEARGVDVDAEAIHATKSALFQEMMAQGRLKIRPGVTDALQKARSEGMKLGFISTTSRANIDTMLDALDLSPEMFDLVTDREDVTNGKPAADVYHLAAERLGVSRAECTVVEDNPDGVRAAVTAGMACIAWPNENTRGHDFTDVSVAGENIMDAIFPATVDVS